MNHPKFTLPLKLNFLQIYKNNYFRKYIKNKDDYYYGFSLKKNEGTNKDLNNSYFRFIPKYESEKDINFKIAKFICLNKKFILKNFWKFLFNRNKFIKSYIKNFGNHKENFFLEMDNTFKFLFNLQNIIYFLHFLNIKKLKIDFFQLEFYFENTQTDNSILVKNTILDVKLDLCKADINTFNLLISKINKIFNLDILTDSNFLNKVLLNDASHHLGGFNYIKNDKKTLINKNLQISKYNNIYVCSSSIFPTAGSVNPNLTIAALGIRLSEFLNNK